MELISANSNYLINLVPQSSVCDCSLTEINPDTSYVTMIPFYFPLLKMLCENECIPLFSIQTNGNLVILQVKTTSPKKYCVRPNIGIIKPKATVEFRGICIPLFYVFYIVFKSPQLCLYLGILLLCEFWIYSQEQSTNIYWKFNFVNCCGIVFQCTVVIIIIIIMRVLAL